MRNQVKHRNVKLLLNIFINQISVANYKYMYYLCGRIPNHYSGFKSITDI